MKTAILLLLKNLGAAFVSRHMIIWGLKLATKYTDNKIDDHVVSLVEAGFDNDIEAIKSSIEGLAANLDLVLREKEGLGTNLDTSIGIASSIPTSEMRY